MWDKGQSLFSVITLIYRKDMKRMCRMQMKIKIQNVIHIHHFRALGFNEKIDNTGEVHMAQSFRTFGEPAVSQLWTISMVDMQQCASKHNDCLVGEKDCVCG